MQQAIIRPLQKVQQRSGMNRRTKLFNYAEVITLAHDRNVALVSSSCVRAVHNVSSSAISWKTRPCRQYSLLKTCAFLAFHRVMAHAAKRICQSFPCMAHDRSELKKSWSTAEEIASSFSPTLVHTASASLHRSTT